MPSTSLPRCSRRGAVCPGMDVSEDSISVGTSHPEKESPAVEKVSHDEVSVHPLFRRFPSPAGVRVCYESGPTGCELCRLLSRPGVAHYAGGPVANCQEGGRANTSKRDAKWSVHLHRAGLSGCSHVRRKLVRHPAAGGADMVDDLSRARERQRASSLLHGCIYRDGARTNQTPPMVARTDLKERALKSTLGRCLAIMDAREAEVEAVNAELHLGSATSSPLRSPGWSLCVPLALFVHLLRSSVVHHLRRRVHPRATWCSTISFVVMVLTLIPFAAQCTISHSRQPGYYESSTTKRHLLTLAIIWPGGSTGLSGLSPSDSEWRVPSGAIRA